MAHKHRTSWKNIANFEDNNLFRIIQFIFLFALLTSLNQLANAGQIDHYNAAKSALKANNIAAYKKNHKAMGDYLLKPVLEYKYLQSRIKTTNNKQIEAFINNNPDLYLSNKLKVKWLRLIAKNGDWKRFDRYYSDSVNDIGLECHALRRLITKKSISQKSDQRINKIWLSAESQPDSCDNVFKRWDNAGKLTNQRVWARTELAIKKGRDKLAHYLSRTYLPSNQRKWVNHWLTVRNNPKKALINPRFVLNSNYAHKIVIDGIEQIARTDIKLAHSIWKQLSQHNRALTKLAPKAYAMIGFRAAINHKPATAFMKKASFDEKKVRHWAIRAALREGQWQAVLDFYFKLPEQEKESIQWRYWQARAMENLGLTLQAQTIFNQISNERDYYSFLAADKSKTTYAMNDQPINNPTNALANSPAFLIAKALYQIEDNPSLMRSQWQWATRKLNPELLKTASKLASQWGLNDRAIITASAAKYYDDVKSRFPIVHTSAVKKYAQSTELPMSYVYAIMRQESAFMQQIKSPAGALGLMQIMPTTARSIAKQQGKKGFQVKDLLNSQINIDMGSYYLRKMLNRFKGHYALATAAYNAGPLRSRQWQSDRQLDADIWIENIPFNETRRYVQNVLTYKAIYDKQLNLKHHPISQLIPKVMAKSL